MYPDTELINLNASNVALASGCNSFASFYVGHYDSFDVTVKSCATCTITYAICFAPFEDAGWFSTAVNFTATSVLEGSATNSFATNHITDNNWRYMKIIAKTSATGGHASGTFTAVLHGTRK